jgi:ArsR family transcriptional regulator, arsenate/arsenite/antimonite-responsive transcriptional repressor
MVKAKKELFDLELQEAALLFKSLAHPARLAILKYLALTNSCVSGDISDELPLSRTTVGQHLKELKKTDLIKGEVEGARVNYCLNNEKIKHLQDLFSPFLDSLCCTTNNECDKNDCSG